MCFNICPTADLTGAHLPRDKPLFVQALTSLELQSKLLVTFIIILFNTAPVVPVEIRAASDAVVAEVLLGLLRAVVLARVRPQQVTHGPEGRRLLEPVELHREPEEAGQELHWMRLYSGLNTQLKAGACIKDIRAETWRSFIH